MLPEINKDKLKMKHLIHVKTDVAISSEDFLYELFQAYEEKNWDPGERGATLPQLKWAGLYSAKPIEGLSIEQSLEKLKDDGYIEIVRKNGAMYHKVIKHPWC